MANSDAKWVMGMMSGTSLDGIDAALLLTDAQEVLGFGPSTYAPYIEADRQIIAQATAWAIEQPSDAVRQAEQDSKRSKGPLAAASRLVAQRHGQAAQALLSKAQNAGAPRPCAIGFHGQTVLHRPEDLLTVQIGDAAYLAQMTGLDVVHDFRTADVAAGGQGAPLAPFYHFALAKRLKARGPVAFLNLGGVANVTWVDPTAPSPAAPGALLAFDTGPANGPLDDWMRARCGRPYDADGALAAQGGANLEWLRRKMDNPYFAKPAPKSLDRADFDGASNGLEHMNNADGAACLAALTAHSVAAATAHLPSAPELWVACGGGRRNKAVMGMLADLLAPAPIRAADELGLDGDMIEAQAFAHLAARNLIGAPITAPGNTGAPRPMLGGALTRAA